MQHLPDIKNIGAYHPNYLCIMTGAYIQEIQYFPIFHPCPHLTPSAKTTCYKLPHKNRKSASWTTKWHYFPTGYHPPCTSVLNFYVTSILVPNFNIALCVYQPTPLNSKDDICIKKKTFIGLCTDLLNLNFSGGVMPNLLELCQTKDFFDCSRWIGVPIILFTLKLCVLSSFLKL